jgi:hypothetical protein
LGLSSLFFLFYPCPYHRPCRPFLIFIFVLIFCSFVFVFVFLSLSFLSSLDFLSASFLPMRNYICFLIRRFIAHLYRLQRLRIFFLS